MKKTLTLGIILVLLLACVGAVSAAPLVTNGGFENPVVGGTFTTLTGAGLTDWTIKSGGSIDLISGYWLPHSGIQSIDLAGNEPGTISQTINTVVDGTYELTFWMAGNPDLQGNKVLEVYWDGAPLSPTIAFDTTGNSSGNMGWTKITIPNLKATKTTTEIAFEHESPTGAYGVALDDISVERTDQTTPVPEFPTMALPAALIVGLIGAVLFIQKSKEE